MVASTYMTVFPPLPSVGETPQATQIMSGYYYRATSLLATLALLGFACAEVRQRVSRSHAHRGAEQPRLFHQGGMDKHAGRAPGSRRRISASLRVEKRDLPQELFHSSPDQHHHRRTQSSCAESSPFEITSSSYPDAEGCYFQTAVDAGDGFVEIIYTPSGEPGVGQLWMHSDAVVTETGTLPGVSARS